VLRSETWTRCRVFCFCRRSLRARRLLALGLAAPLLSAAKPLCAQDVPVEGPVVRANVNRVNVGVTVSDKHGRFVHDLNRTDFRIFDNGVEQPVADFLPVDQPAQVLLLIEGGPSVLFFAKSHILAADQMVASLAADDRVAIATYTKGPEGVIDFTTDKAQARMALRGINFVAGFGELNLFSSIAASLDALARYPGKKAIVLLSTGVDTSPDVNFGALLEKLETSEVTIIAVSLSADIRKPVRKRKLTAGERADRARLEAGFREADRSLSELGKATGGRVYFASGEKEFAKTYAEIADRLRHEYSLAFVPPALDGRIHSLRVEVKRPRVEVEHRPAYRAGSEWK
jgi:Ca-activated chloride channel homolog